MKSLVGSGKQVAWAHDIREGIGNLLGTLKEAEAAQRDLTMEEEVVADPIFGQKQIIKKYASHITDTQRAAIYSVSQFLECAGRAPEIIWKENREKEIGGEHAGRLAEADYIALLVSNIEKALETETNARFWIDHR